MNTKKLIASLALVAGLSVAATAQAEGKIYVGAKLGDARSDIYGFYDDSLTAGVYGGYNLLGKDAHFAANLGGGTLAVEGAIDTTTVRGKTLWGKWDVNSAAVYAAYRFPLSNSFYLKGKAGFVHYTVDTTYPPALPGWVLVQTGTNDTLAAGIGGGYKFGPGALELDVTSFSGNMLTATVGFHMSF